MMDTALLKHLESYLTENRRQLFKEIAEQRTRHFTVVTEDVYQLHNASAVMRSCDVFGIQDLHIVEAPENANIEKDIALGAQKWVDLHCYRSMGECVEKLQKQGYRIIAATPHGDAQPLHEFDIDRKVAFCFGTEKEGLSAAALALADGRIRIPMYGFSESLNVSVSAAIVLQYAVTRLRDSAVPWQLSEEEQLEKRLDWARKTVKSADRIIELFYSGRK